MAKAKILITGGGGYIGSHVLKLLGKRGDEILVIDNFSRGWRDAVLYGKVLEMGIEEKKVFEAVKEFRPDAVIHFAAFICAEESVEKPLLYYRNNFLNSIIFFNSIIKAGVKRIIFSSSAAVYGNPEKIPVNEENPLNPVNPYGHTKCLVEEYLKKAGERFGISYVNLRYFNACGADPEGDLGERHNPETHLIPLLLKTAKGERKEFYIYGTDYPTKDGTCVRDFIHVIDLARIHILSTDYLLEGGESDIFNCGYGKGYSVLEVINAAKKITGIDIPVRVKGRRAGDPVQLIADPSKLMRKLNWRPEHDDLEFIIKTAWEWEKKLNS